MTFFLSVTDKKHHIIHTSMQMFYMHGIHAVGMNEIVKVSGIAKKTLYRNFESKEQLVVATLNLRHQNFINWLSIIFDQAKSPQEGIIEVFIGLNEWFNGRVIELGPFRGCFFINASAEYSQLGHPIFEVCKKHKENVNTLFINQILLFISDVHQAERLGNVLSILKDGCITAAHIKNDNDAALKIIETVKSLVEI